MRLSGHDIICLSALDWDDPAGVSRHAVMSRLAELNRVLVVDPPWTALKALEQLTLPSMYAKWPVWLKQADALRRIAHNLFVWTPPLAWAASPDRKFRKALRALCRSQGFDSPILWIDPLATPPPQVGDLGEILVVAQCGEGHDPASLQVRQCLQQADLAFLATPEQLASLEGAHRHAHHIPDGIDFDTFNRAVYPDTPLPRDLSVGDEPIVGYVGGIGQGFDFALWEWLAERRSGYRFVALGKVEPSVSGRVEHAQRLPNVRFLGDRALATYPCYLKAMAAIALPWCLESRGRMLLAVYEGLAAGKAVVTTLPGEAVRGVVRTHRPTVFLEALDQAVKDQGVRAIAERIRGAQTQTWEARCRHMEGLILDALATRIPPAAIPLQLERIVRPGASAR